MITQNEIKYYTSLLQKKYRQKEKKFIAEGEKLVTEGIESGLIPEIIVASAPFYDEQQDYLRAYKKFRIERIKTRELNKLTETKSPQGVLAVFPFAAGSFDPERISSAPVVYLDNVADPGNAGTIIRNCDWFGVTVVLLGEGCVELYNPKVVRSSMGSLFHLNIYENVKPGDLEKLKRKGYKLICSDVRGDNVFEFKIPEKSIIVFSNEARGPDNKILELADYIISIPKAGRAESLNVASASAVILSSVGGRERERSEIRSQRSEV